MNGANIDFGTTIDIQSNVYSSMGNVQIEEQAEDIIKSTLVIEEEKEQKIRKRISIKDYNITGYAPKDVKEFIEESKRTKIIEWLSSKVSVPYSDTYIAIKRNSYITNMIEQLQEVDQAFKNKDTTASEMFLVLFNNEINTIYKNFIQTGQEENFLSIVNLLEDILCNKKIIDKTTLKESISLLKNVKTKSLIEYTDYENALKRFFDRGINLVNFQEPPNDA